MDSATFLLVINAAIGVAFALCFAGLSRLAETRRGLWFTAGFLAASGTALAEIAARLGLAPRLASFLSYSLLLIALCLILEGVSRYFRRLVRPRTLIALVALGLVFKLAVLDILERDGGAHAIGYQLAFAVVSALAAASVLSTRRRTVAQTALGWVFAAISVQFLLKSDLAIRLTTGSAVQSYAVSRYAFYSQTLGAILSLLMGLCLLAVVGREVLRDQLARSETDILSGLAVRRAFYERAEALLAGGGFHGVLVICDLDHFKRVNDTFGHAAGDEVIAAFGRLLGAAAGPLAICGRLGGEEFAALLPAVGEAEAIAFVRDLQAAHAGLHYHLLPGTYQVTASYGLTLIGRTAALEDCVRAADGALYAAKAAGRNTFTMAAPAASVA